jgi:hypothetical protein
MGVPLAASGKYFAGMYWAAALAHGHAEGFERLSPVAGTGREQVGAGLLALARILDHMLGEYAPFGADWDVAHCVASQSSCTSSRRTA